MRNLFTMIAFLFFGLALTGCYDMHGLPPVIPMGDAGPTVGDAGIPMPEPDSGPVVVADAGTDSGPVVEPDAGSDAGSVEDPDAGPLPVELVVDPFFSGWDTPAGQQDMATADIHITAAHDLEWREGVMFQIRAITPGCMVRGSRGTEYFRDIKIKNTETGMTLMGPVSMPTLSDGATSTGFFRVGWDARTIPTGTTWRFAVTMDLSSVEDAPGEFVGCSYNVYTGMEGGSIIEASSVRYPGGAALTPEQIGGDNAASYSGFTVSAPLIEAGEMPPSEILVAGADRWYHVASYDVVRDGIDAVFVMIDGFAEDTSEVAIAHYDAALGTEVVIGRAFLPSGENSGRTVILDSSLAAGEAFEIWVRVPFITTDTSLRPRTGDSFRMGVNGVTRAGRFFDTSPLFGNEFVIRKTRPTFTLLSPPTTPLGTGLQGMVSIQVSADSAGCLALRAFDINVVLTESEDSNITVGSLELVEGTRPLDASLYTIRDSDGRDLRTQDLRFWPTTMGPATASSRAYVVFTEERLICGSGRVYSLRGIIGGILTSGDVVSFGIPRNIDTSPLTGHVSEADGIAIPGGIGTHLEVDGVLYHASPLWSDLSAVPHSSAPRAAGGSRDWIDGQLLGGYFPWSVTRHVR
ncbi:hypothetical protein M0Q28_04405 [Patescibacteria group bacterium]|jgi:hypothetical protein|nr:hypothetical protein [Patescibacteria group bacterium]